MLDTDEFDLCKAYRDFSDNKISVLYPDKTIKLFDIPALVQDIVNGYNFK
jgi:hypothetical protein